MESIGDGVVKERRETEESLRDQKDSLHQDLELEVLAEIDSGKIAHRKHQDNEVSDRRIASDPKVFQVVALLDIAERFITLPAGQIDLNNLPDALFDPEADVAAGQKHHGLLAKPLDHDQKEPLGSFGELDWDPVVPDGSDLLAALFMGDERRLKITR